MHQNLINKKPYQLSDLLEIMKALRTPETGCPWDLKQNFKTIAPYTVEEAYEVADAIDHKDWGELKEELGDLLFQVVFHTQMAQEEDLFTFDDVVNAICTKMLSRHPHVFSGMEIKDVDGVNTMWADKKAEERKAKGKSDENSFILDDVMRAQPALMRAQKIQKKAIAAGFNWDNIDQVFEKLDEEVAELKEAIKSKKQSDIQDELGDVLFVGGILGQWLGIDAETALHDASNKFQRRFNSVESGLRSKNKSFKQSDLDEMNDLWNQAKSEEKHAKD